MSPEPDQRKNLREADPVEERSPGACNRKFLAELGEGGENRRTGVSHKRMQLLVYT